MRTRDEKDGDMRLRTVLIGALVLALLATMAVLGVAAAIAARDGWFSTLGDIRIGPGDLQFQGTPVTRTFGDRGPVAVEVAVDRGDVVVVRGGARATVVVTPTAHAASRDAGLAALAAISPTIAFANGRLVIRWSDAAPRDLRRANGALDVFVRLPDAVTATLAARTHAGDIAARGLGGAVAAETDFGDVDVSGSRGGVRASSASGDITVADVDAPTADVALRTEFGDVRLTRLRAATVRAESSSGDLSATDVAATGAAGLTLRTRFGDVGGAGIDARAVAASSDSGDVRLVLRRLAGPLEATTRFGDVDVTLPAGAGADAVLTTRFGALRAPFVTGRRADDAARGEPVAGRIGAGGPAVTLSTDSGDVRLTVAGADD